MSIVLESNFPINKTNGPLEKITSQQIRILQLYTLLIIVLEKEDIKHKDVPPPSQKPMECFLKEKRVPLSCFAI